MPIGSELLIYKNIELFGQKYIEENIHKSDTWGIKKVADNWWEALKFFFSRSFFRGRRDELSNDYYCFTLTTLETRYDIPETNSITKEKLDSCHEKLRKDSKNELVESLRKAKTIPVIWEGKTEPKKIHLGNETDVQMVLGCLKLISNEDKRNIYNYLKEGIANSRVKEVYDELDDIFGIGDKIASLIIRDVMLMNSEMSVRYEDYSMAFPVDTWVRKIARKLDINGDDNKIKDCLIKKCKNFNVDPLMFAAGIWYLGANSLDLLLEKLGEVDFK